MITTLQKETTNQYKSLPKELKEEVLKLSKLEKPDYSLQRFNTITKEIYYKNILRTNLAIVNKHANDMLEKENYTKEDVLEIAKITRTIQEFVEGTPEFKKILDEKRKEQKDKDDELIEKLKTVKKKPVKKVVKKKEVNLNKNILEELGLEKLDGLFSEDL